jgi:large subunit ribosomal protein L4
MQVKLYNQNAEAIGDIELPDSIFARPFNADLVHQVARVMRANQRKVLAHAKPRGEVRGGGRKPWRQKGTGRARHGSIRSPLWRGGGVTHGPTKERVYALKIPKKMRRAALAMVLSQKVRREMLKVIDQISLSQPKTKEAAAVLDRFLLADKKRKRGLLILAGKNEVLERAVRNYPAAKTVLVSSLNILDLLNYQYLLILKDAVSMLDVRN